MVGIGMRERKKYVKHHNMIFIVNVKGGWYNGFWRQEVPVKFNTTSFIIVRCYPWSEMTCTLTSLLTQAVFCVPELMSRVQYTLLASPSLSFVTKKIHIPSNPQGTYDAQVDTKLMDIRQVWKKDGDAAM